jgi:hypothetical protein
LGFSQTLDPDPDLVAPPVGIKTKNNQQGSCVANEFFYSESLAAGSLDQLPAPLERNLADA